MTTTDIATTDTRSPTVAEQIATVRRLIAPPTANDTEVELLVRFAHRLGLDPLRGHVALIPRWDGQLRRIVHRPFVTADGRLVLARATGELRELNGPTWCAGEKDRTGNYTWHDVWLDEEPPHAARYSVLRAGMTAPVVGTVPWREFAQRGRDGELLPTWRTMPSHMLAKTALSLALRRAFPDIIGGDDEDLAEPELLAQQPVAQDDGDRPMSQGNVDTFYDKAFSAGLEEVAIAAVVRAATDGRTDDPTEVLVGEIPTLRAALETTTAPAADQQDDEQQY